MWNFPEVYQLVGIFDNVAHARWIPVLKLRLQMTHPEIQSIRKMVERIQYEPTDIDI
jgi:hypothetical protein